jgi:cytochrome d ubiquinol oxidase subunit II
LQEDFRRRALLTWLAAGIASFLLLGIAATTAGRLWDELTTPPASLLVLSGVLLAPASAFALWRRRFHLSRVLGAAQATVLLLGWAAAQWPYLVYPAYTITDAAAPRATLLATAITLPFGLGVLIPSLWFLFAVFKRRPRDDRGVEAGPVRG